MSTFEAAPISIAPSEDAYRGVVFEALREACITDAAWLNKVMTDAAEILESPHLYVDDTPGTFDLGYDEGLVPLKQTYWVVTTKMIGATEATDSIFIQKRSVIETEHGEAEFLDQIAAINPANNSLRFHTERGTAEHKDGPSEDDLAFVRIVLQDAESAIVQPNTLTGVIVGSWKHIRDNVKVVTVSNEHIY